jgi:hypothetical protein
MGRIRGMYGEGREENKNEYSILVGKLKEKRSPANRDEGARIILKWISREI